MVAAGVPRERALRAATADAWRYLGRPREGGVIEVGARADLVLVASDPLRSPLPLLPEGVMVRGTWLSRSELDARLADIRKRSARASDPWAGAPRLAGGDAAREARYDMVIRGTIVGRERLVVGRAGSRAAGERTITGQIADRGAGIDGVDTSYVVGPDRATVTSTYHTMKVEMTGTITAGRLTVTGTDLAGQALSLSQPVPPGAFLSAPGIGGAMRLVDRLLGMKPGAKRVLTSLALAYSPSAAIVSARHQVERRPDAGGNRVFAVTTTQGGSTVSAKLVVDSAGLIVSQTLGPPVATTIRRSRP
jgi:Amidohydrolase family